MALPLTTILTRWTLGSYDGETVGVLLVDATGAENAASTAQYVSDVSTDELDGSGYDRGTVDLVLTADGETLHLTHDPEGTPYVTDTTGNTPAGVWYFDPAGGSDAARKLLVFLPIEPEAGFDGWELVAPLQGIARVNVSTDALLVALGEAIADIDGGTP
jgi:hypothetical protein